MTVTKKKNRSFVGDYLISFDALTCFAFGCFFLVPRHRNDGNMLLKSVIARDEAISVIGSVYEGVKQEEMTVTEKKNRSFVRDYLISFDALTCFAFGCLFLIPRHRNDESFSLISI